ncbi:MAG: C39 family peptidase, partial [Acidobacteria bacterium]|nr:C39 family peptidase [Acidobacteriota bacterium]
MTRHRARVIAAAVVLVMTAAAAPGAEQAPTPSTTISFLDVPYLPQTEALCGGAAAAMVMRYWGAAGVHPETFSALVDTKAGGI